MTQFLLVQTATPPSVSGYRATRADEAEYFLAPAIENFGAIENVWVIRPLIGEMDDLVDEAREQILGGRSYQSTELYALFSGLVHAVEALAFYWASYPDDLPLASNARELHATIERDISSDTSSSSIIAGYRSISIRAQYTLIAGDDLTFPVCARNYVIFANGFAFTVGMTSAADPRYYEENEFSAVLRSITIGRPLT